MHIREILRVLFDVSFYSFQFRNEKDKLEQWSKTNGEQEGYSNFLSEDRQFGKRDFNRERVSKTRGLFVWRRGLVTMRSCENMLLLARIASVSSYASLLLTAAASGATIVRTLLTC